MSPDYAPSRKGVGITDRRVVNAYRRPDGKPNPHKSYGYLRVPEFSALAAPYATGRADAARAAE